MKLDHLGNPIETFTEAEKALSRELYASGAHLRNPVIAEKGEPYACRRCGHTGFDFDHDERMQLYLVCLGCAQRFHLRAPDVVTEP